MEKLFPIDVNHAEREAQCLIIDSTCPAFPFLNKYLNDRKKGEINTPEVRLYMECRNTYRDAIHNMPPQTGWDHNMLEDCAYLAFGKRRIAHERDKELARKRLARGAQAQKA